MCIRDRVEAFKSGAKYQEMDSNCRALIKKMEQNRIKYQNELARAHAETIDVRNKWFQTCDDLDKEHAAEIKEKDREIAMLKARLLEVERQRDAALDKVTEQRHELYEVKTELEEEKGRNLKLTAQLNRDYENSGKPSSQSPNHGKIANGREKTGRKPGGQPGHKGHGRIRQEPTKRIHLPIPEEIAMDPDFKKTTKTITKQMVRLQVNLEVLEYEADVYYNSKTGERVHAPFPEGVVNDINYDGTIRAFLFLLNDHCNVSIDKARGFLCDITAGKLRISKGMIASLRQEFACKTKAEQDKAFNDLLMTPVLHSDCTNARINGKPAYVYVCASPDGTVQFYARDKKGHAGIKETPVEDYQGVLVHDHDVTFYHYGRDHQECNVHVLRYLKDSIENEPDRTWSTKMRALMQEMIHHRNELGNDKDMAPDKVKAFESRYHEILKTAETEYEDVPPSKYYMDGYNLYKRMKKYEHNHLLFLHDKRVPFNNNISERYLRSYKRKQQAVISLRAPESLDYISRNMGTLNMIRNLQEENLFDSVVEIFNRNPDPEQNVPSV